MKTVKTVKTFSGVIMAVEPSAPPFQLFTSVRYDESLCSVPQDAAFAHAGWNYRQSSPYYMLDFHRDRLLRAAKHWQWYAAISAVSGDAGLAALKQTLDAAVASIAREGASAPPTPLRCRVTLDRDGQLACEATAATEAPLAGLFPLSLPPPGYMMSDSTAPSTAAEADVEASPDTALCRCLRTALAAAPWDVTVDISASPASAYTHYKTTRRQVYDAARQRAGITAAAMARGQRREVLLINASSGTVMDGSISTVYLWRNGRWVAPPVPARFSDSAEVDTKPNSSGGLDGTTRRWSLERGLAVEENIRADSLRNGEECWLSNGVRGFLYGTISLQRAEQAP